MRRKIGVLLLFFLIIIIIGGSFSNFSFANAESATLYVNSWNQSATYEYTKYVSGYKICGIAGGGGRCSIAGEHKVSFKGVGTYDIVLILANKKDGRKQKYLNSKVTVKMKYTVKKGSKSVYPTVGKYTTYDVPKYIKERI